MSRLRRRTCPSRVGSCRSRRSAWMLSACLPNCVVVMPGVGVKREIEVWRVARMALGVLRTDVPGRRHGEGQGSEAMLSESMVSLFAVLCVTVEEANRSYGSHNG